MEIPKPEKPKPEIYLPEVKEVIKSDVFFPESLKLLASMSEKKETLRHSQRVANIGCLLANQCHFSEEEKRNFIETSLLHDIGKAKLPQKYLTIPSARFSLKDLKVIEDHSLYGFNYLKENKRSPRVYNPVLIHHEFQAHAYPHTKASILRILGAMEDEDVDKGILLAMVDVFDTAAFGRASVKMAPQTLGQVKERLMGQFKNPGDIELIDFLCERYETIKKLSGE